MSKQERKRLLNIPRTRSERVRSIEKLNAKPRVFISYSHHTDDNPEFSEKIYNDLQALGYTVWFDKNNLYASGGEPFLREIRDQIAESVDCVLFVVGPRSVKSAYCKQEWQTAFNLCKRVIPLLHKGSQDLVPPEISHLESIDCSLRNRSYEKILHEITESLNKPQKHCETYGVPELPRNHISRPDEIKEISKIIFSDISSPKVIKKENRITSIVGRSGEGKTTLANEFALDCRTTQNFKHGIIWINYSHGERLDEKAILNNLLDALKIVSRQDAQTCSSVEMAQVKLEQLLHQKNYLFIIDNVWHKQQVEPFLSAMKKSTSRILITTQRRDLALALGSHQHDVKQLTQKQATLLLLSWGKDKNIASPSAEVAEIAERCGYNPLALSMIGSSIGPYVSWGDKLKALKSFSLNEIENSNLRNYDKNLVKAIAVSVESLGKSEQQLYNDLVLFPRGTPLSLPALKTLWRDRIEGDNHSRERKIRAFFQLIIDRSLATQDKAGNCILLDLQHDFVRYYLNSKKGSYSKLHSRLVDEYSKQASKGWHTVKDDGYFYGNIIRHLVHSKNFAELEQVVLNIEWLVNSIQSTNAFPFIELQLQLTELLSYSKESDYAEIETNYLSLKPAIQEILLAVFKSDFRSGKTKQTYVSEIANRLQNSKNPKINEILRPHTHSFQKSNREKANDYVIERECDPGYYVENYVISMNEEVSLKKMRNLISVQNHKTGNEIWLDNCSEVISPILTPDGKVIVAFDKSMNKLLCLLVENNKTMSFSLASKIEGTMSLEKLSMSPEGKYAIGGTNKGEVILIKAKDGKFENGIEGFNTLGIKSKSKITDIQIVANSTKGDYIGIARADGFERLDLTNKEGIELHIPQSPTSISLLNSGTVFLGTKIGHLLLCDEELNPEVFHTHKFSITCVAAGGTPQRGCIVSGDTKGNLRISLFTKDIAIRDKVLPNGHDSSITTVSINNEVITTTSKDGVIKIWLIEKLFALLNPKKRS